MNIKCDIKIAYFDYRKIMEHLYPGDKDEHGAVLLAGISIIEGKTTFYIREVHFAIDNVDYVSGQIGYKALSPTFIHKMITRARDEQLVYLAIHNHMSDEIVGFSKIDYESHERGYPALLQIANGMPVGALVFGERSLQADIWLPDGNRMKLDEATVIGKTIQKLTSTNRHLEPSNADYNSYDRQVRMFGRKGQAKLSKCKIAIIGLGGIGSLVAEYLARLGIGSFLLIDDDLIEESNFSRVVGATRHDITQCISKVDISCRLIREANPSAAIECVRDDVAKYSVANKIIRMDYIFLAADSMRARLVVNAIVNQYFIPAVQLGSKIRTDEKGNPIEIMSVNRPLRPGTGCLWCNQLVDPTILAMEAKTDEERKLQAYGVEEINPSVISLNSISASHAVNDFLLDYLNIRSQTENMYYEHYHHLTSMHKIVIPRKSPNCSECSNSGQRYARADQIKLPCSIN